LNEDKLRHRLEAGMSDLLAQRCISAKMNKVAGLKKWLTEVKRIDDSMQAKVKQFEQIVRSMCKNSRHANPLGEPSNRMNVQQGGNCAGGTSKGSATNRQALKLMDRECCLLFNNNGCLKCRRFFAGHWPANCPNEFPSGMNYRTLMQADADKAKWACGLHTITVAVQGNASDDDIPIRVHPVAVVLGSSSAPVAYMPANQSNVIEEGGLGSDDNVRTTLNVSHHELPRVTQGCVPKELAPLHLSHLYWHCATGVGSWEFPTIIHTMIDNGAHAVLIDENFV
jgi:hypothetical protein